MKRKWFLVALLLLPALMLVAGPRTETKQDEPAEAMMAGPEGKYGESPMLTALVARGDLPPVDERLPLNPKVQPLVDGVGKYGGTIRVVAPYSEPYSTFQGGDLGPFLLTYDEELRFIGDLVEDFDFSDDLKTLTLFLREGLKWSDGEPFTADDIVSTLEDLDWNDEVGTWESFGQQGDTFESVTAVDDFTVQYELAEPGGGLLAGMASWGGSRWSAFQPMHYLSQFHIDYNADADAEAKEAGYDGWGDQINALLDTEETTNPDKPVVGAWIIDSYTSNQRTYVRNPYFYKIDTANNQLPYIDRVQWEVVDGEVMNLKIINGEVDIEFAATEMSNYTLYKENEAAGDYKVVLIPGTNGANGTIGIYQNSPDPILGPLYRDVRFRQALSLAIDRDEINEAIYLGLAVPRQPTVISSASYFKPVWAETYAQHDPAQANRLLDQIGLSAKDTAGFRLGSNRNRIQVVLEADGGKVAEAELIKEHWAAVGIDTLIHAPSGDLFDERGEAPDHGLMMVNMYSGEEIAVFEEPSYFIPQGDQPAWGTLWEIWLEANDSVKAGSAELSDFEGGTLPGEEPPQDVKEIWDVVARWQGTLLGSSEYRRLAEQIFDFYAEKLYMIGTVGMSPTPLIAKNTLGNVPKDYYIGNASWTGALNYWAPQIYFK